MAADIQLPSSPDLGPPSAFPAIVPFQSREANRQAAVRRPRFSLGAAFTILLLATGKAYGAQPARIAACDVALSPDIQGHSPVHR